jgi:hypothetical protein
VFLQIGAIYFKKLVLIVGLKFFCTIEPEISSRVSLAICSSSLSEFPHLRGGSSCIILPIHFYRLRIVRSDQTRPLFLPPKVDPQRSQVISFTHARLIMKIPGLYNSSPRKWGKAFVDIAKQGPK